MDEGATKDDRPSHALGNGIRQPVPEKEPVWLSAVSGMAGSIFDFSYKET